MLSNHPAVGFIVAGLHRYITINVVFVDTGQVCAVLCLGPHLLAAWLQDIPDGAHVGLATDVTTFRSCGVVGMSLHIGVSRRTNEKRIALRA